MRNRSAALALVLLLLTSVDLPPFGGRLTAQNQQPVPFNVLFTEVPPVGTPLSLGAFAPLVNPIPVADHTFGISMEGEIDFFNPRTGSMRLHLMPYGAGSEDAIAFSIGFARATPGATTPDILVTGPQQPANRPFQLFQLTTPPSLLFGEPDTWAQAGGLRLDIADVDADQSSEFIFGSGPGGPGLVSIVAPSTGTRLEFAPFPGDYRGGVSIAAGDIVGDSHDEIVIGQETGGEFRLYDVVADIIRLRAIGHPYGPNFTGGVRVAVGDIDGDGRGDIITAPAHGEPLVRGLCLNGPTPIASIAEFLAFEPTRTDGVFVDTGISAGRPLIITTTGNRYAQFEARANEGVRPIGAFLEELGNNQPYENSPMPVNTGGGWSITGPRRK